jgi:predicted AAA+ superfamily ATPase
MKREFEKYLKVWKVAKERKPLLLRDARHVGKTWLLKKIAQENFEHIV